MSVHDASPHADLPWRVGFSHVPGIGPGRLAGLERDFGSLAQAWASPEPELALTLGPALARVVTQTRARVDVDRVMERLARHRITLLAPDMEHYPPLLRAIPAPPFLLYVQGNPAVLAGHAVAVVGTRNASAFGCATARTLAAGVAGAGGTVVSGMAVGIDAAAHRGALDGGGPTVAVLGCGLFVDHPAANRALRADVAGSGAVVSQFPPGATAQAGNFPARNRVVSGISACTVVVEAPPGSGALITARQAVQQGREVLFVPGVLDSDAARGCAVLEELGASVAWSTAAALRRMGYHAPDDRLGHCGGQVLSQSERALLAELGPLPRHVDELGRAAQLPAREVTRILSIMEIKGMARHIGHMRWTAAP